MDQKISPAKAMRMLAAGQAEAVDVREPDEYAAGHIPGAKLLPLGTVAHKAASILPNKQAAYLVYCRSGRRSAIAALELRAQGYQNIYDLGGILDWPYKTVKD